VIQIALAELNLAALDAAEADGIALFVAKDERPLRGLAGLCDWRLCGTLSRVVRSGFFAGAPGEALLIPGKGRLRAIRVFALGLGARTDTVGRAILRKAFEVCSRAGVRSLALSLESLPIEREEGARLFLELARHSHFESFVLFGDTKALQRTLGSMVAVGERVGLIETAGSTSNHRPQVLREG
jgi:hypothetical protein